MTEINDLRERVEAAEKRFGLIDEQQSHYSERVIGLIEAIEAQLATARSEIEKQIAENRHLTEENEELRGMLHSVLRSIEEKTFTQTLQNLEARVSALVEVDDDASKVMAALSEGLAKEEMSAEELLAEEAMPADPEDLTAEAGSDPAPEAGAAADIQAEIETFDETEAAVEAEALLETEEAAPAADSLIIEASEPAAETAEALPEAFGEEPTAALAEEAAAPEDLAEEAVADTAPAEEAVGQEARAEEASADEILADETPAETAEANPENQAPAELSEEDLVPEGTAAEVPDENDDDDSVHDLLAAMAELRASDVADAAILEANPEIAKLMEEAKALEKVAADALDLAAPEAEAVAEDEAAMEDAAEEAFAMEAPEAAESEAAEIETAAPEAAEPEVAEPEVAAPEAAEPPAEGAPTVKEIIRRVGALARELEHAEAQRRTSLDEARKQAALADSDSPGDAALDHAASA